MKQYAIFDMDGTLLDSMHIWDDAADVYLASKGIEPPEGLRDAIKCLSLQETADYFLANFPIRLTPEQVMREIKEQVWEEYRDRVQLKEHVADFLRRAGEQGIHMCVASASEREEIEAALRRCGVLDCFDFILSCTEAGAGKSSPAIYDMAARRWGVPPGEIMVFEDALHAIETARNAGYYVVGVYDPSSRQDEAEIRRISDRYIMSFDEMR